jgi:hypothetical protein
MEVEPGGELTRGGPAGLGAWGLEWRRATRASLLRTLLLVRVKSVKWQQQKELCVASKWDEVVVLSPSLRENSAVARPGRIVYASNVSRWPPGCWRPGAAAPFAPR